MSGIDINRLGPDARRQIAAKTDISFEREQKRSKYGNVKTVRVMPNGMEHVFDSKKEAERYDELMALLYAGKIRNLKLQPHYTFGAPYITSDGEKVTREDYVADFAYEKQVEYATPSANGPAAPWVHVVEDVKGKKTQMYLRKKNVMLEKYHVTITEV